MNLIESKTAAALTRLFAIVEKPFAESFRNKPNSRYTACVKTCKLAFDRSLATGAADTSPMERPDKDTRRSAVPRRVSRWVLPIFVLLFGAWANQAQAASAGCSAINTNASNINRTFYTGAQGGPSNFLISSTTFAAGDVLTYSYTADAQSVPRVQYRVGSGLYTDTFTPQVYSSQTTVSRTYTFTGNETTIRFFAASQDGNNNFATDETTVTYANAVCNPASSSPAAPTSATSLSPTSIVAGDVSTMTVTLTNPNTSSISGVADSITLPSGVVVAATPNASNTCGATFTPSAGSSSLSLSGGSINASASCSFQVAITSLSTDGSPYTIPAGTPSATGASAGTAGTSEQLTVTAPSAPIISAAFSPTSIASGGNATLTLTISNPNSGTTLTGVAVGAASLPANLSGSNPGTTCAGGSLSLSGATLASSASCTVTLSVTSTTPGTYSYTSGAVSASGPTSVTGSTATTPTGLTVNPPTLTTTQAVPSTTLTSGTAATPFTPVTASGGTGTLSYALSGGTLPTGLSFSTTSGQISGTPSTLLSATTFTVTVTDQTTPTAQTSAKTFSLTVNAPSTTFVFTPSAGTLKPAMVGEDYSQLISANGGVGALIYSLISGTLPRGMTLNISTGELTGPLAADAEVKDYPITIQVRDGNGSTGTTSYTLSVRQRAVTVTDKVVDVPVGSSPADVYLNRGATGGPFVRADKVFVEPANAGNATIIRGQLAQAGPVTTPVGWYLQFTPNPAYSGQVRVGFRLTSALGASNIGTVTYNIAVNAAKVAADIDKLVHGFVRTRQNMISSSIHVPGLLERRQMSEAADPVTAHMMTSENGMTVNFSTSLAQMESARNRADGILGGYPSPFNIWIDGAFLAHNAKEINGGKWGSFAMLNMGADYLLNEKTLVGLSFHYDHMSDPTDEDAQMKGNGWLAGPYASLEIGKDVFWNASFCTAVLQSRSTQLSGTGHSIRSVLWPIPRSRGSGSLETTPYYRRS